MDEVTREDQVTAEQVLGEMVLGNETRAIKAVARHRTASVAAATADLRERLAEVIDALDIMHTAFAGYADTDAKREAVQIARAELLGEPK